jgi:hypothetical protein
VDKLLVSVCNVLYQTGKQIKLNQSNILVSVSSPHLSSMHNLKQIIITKEKDFEALATACEL